MADHGLTLGAFDLIDGTGVDDDGGAYQVKTVAEGMDFGTATAREVVHKSLLRDGGIVVIEGHDSREVLFKVRITGDTNKSVAAGERRLRQELERRNELVWQPPKGADASVYDVVISTWSRDTFVDLDEKAPRTRGRTYALRLICDPFPRSAVADVVAAVTTGEPPPVENTVLVDNCSLSTGWAPLGDPSYGTSISAVSGQIRVVNGSDNNYPYGLFIGATRTGVIDLTATPYLIIDVQSRQGVPRWSAAEINGGVRPIATGPSPDFPGRVRLWFRPGVSSLSDLYLDVPMSPDYASQTQSFAIEQVARTNLPPFVGSGRQQFRLLTVKGSETTQGSLQVSHETLALGETIIYTCRDNGSGYQPACRQFRNTAASGAPVPDSTSASGAWSPLDTVGKPETYDIPARTLRPETYVLRPLLRAAVAGSYPVTYKISTRLGGNNLGTITSTRLLTLTTTGATHDLSTVTLPPTAVPPGSEAVVRIEISSPNDVEIDDLYVFNVESGALSIIQAGTGSPAAGGSSSRVWLDTPTLDWPQDACWLGTEADRSDARHALTTSEALIGLHVFEPGIVNLFYLTRNAPYAAASLRYFRHHSFNADDE